MFANAPELHEGDSVDGHRIVRVIGAGGMGTVYEAEHPRLKRNVALKIVRFRDREPEEEDFLRFAREAAAMARVEDPNVVTIYDHAEWKLDNGALVPYFTMQLVVGRALSDRLVEADYSLDDALTALRGAAAGLDACHAEGVIHRDVKPHNVLVKAAGGGGLLSDFGIARIPAYTTVTQPPIRLGTAAYVAPELLLGEEATPRSDIFSFGCTVYFAMTGQMPRETPVWDAQVIAPSRRKPELARVDGVLLQALAAAPSDRHGSAQELIDDVRAALDEQRTVRQPRTVRDDWIEPPPPRRQISPAEHGRPRQAKVRPKPAFADPPSGPRIKIEILVAVALVLLVVVLVVF